MTNVAESFGLPATADFMIAIVTNEELESLNQYMVLQIKNRYNAKTANKKFCIGVDTAKMRLYDLEDSAQTLLPDAKVENDILKEKFKSLKT